MSFETNGSVNGSLADWSNKEYVTFMKAI